MNKQQAQKKAKSFFDNNEALRKLHITNDGQAFELLNRAEVHQKEIDGKYDDIITVKREDVEEVIPVEVSNKTNDLPEMKDHVVTQEDLDAKPELVEQGVEVGETIQVPVTDN